MERASEFGSVTKYDSSTASTRPSPASRPEERDRLQTGGFLIRPGRQRHDTSHNERSATSAAARPLRSPATRGGTAVSVAPQRVSSLQESAEPCKETRVMY